MAKVILVSYTEQELKQQSLLLIPLGQGSVIM